MPDENAQKSNSDNGGSAKEVQGHDPWRAATVPLIMLVCVTVMACLARASLYFAQDADRVKFLTESILSALIVLVVVVQAWIYNQQRELMGQQLTLARKQFNAIERPYVSREAVNWAWHSDNQRQGRYLYSIYPVLVNSGNTPTKNMLLNANCDLFDSPLSDGFEFPYASKDYPATIGIRGQITAKILWISDADLLAIQNRTKYFYIWGKAEYYDLFENTPMHTTTFCNQITSVLGNPLDPRDTRDHTRTSVSIAFEIYHKHNDAN